ncbi:hypothetical protein LPJ66_001840 [Kickxella alabastrina]|uniref:Uncharacterized protein n=1 Tax=Kickxella alabastrina TaxID=61397 RepID=A0ACC1IS45_9FUNG|nr:hypothetical protein LPJ66_001840 [Kickxella alabastrina]
MSFSPDPVMREVTSDSGIQTCDQISDRQQRLLMQCYCKKEYNTLFVKYNKAASEVVCTRMDKHMYTFNATLVCQTYRDYDCVGVNADASAVSTTKVLVVATLLISFLFV